MCDHLHADAADDERRKRARHAALASLLLFSPWKKLRPQIAMATHDLTSYFDAVDLAMTTGTLTSALKSGSSVVPALTKLIQASLIGGYQAGGGLIGKMPGSRMIAHAEVQAREQATVVSRQMLKTSKKWLKADPSSEFALSSARAERAARFETAKAYYEGLQKMLWGYGMQKRWLTTSDAPCEECFVDGTLVRTGPLKAAFVREHTGLFVTLELSNGNLLTGTANHPIFTRSGWKPLCALDKSDYLFDGKVTERMLWGHKYFDKTVSRIEDITDLAQWAFISPRLVAATDQFHGDVSDGEVYTKRTKRLLDDDARKLRVQKLQKGLLIGCFCALVVLLGYLSFCDCGKDSFGYFRLRSVLPAFSAATAERFFFFGGHILPAVFISFLCFVGILLAKFGSLTGSYQPSCLRYGTQGISACDESTAQGYPRDASSRCYIFSRPACLIQCVQLFGSMTARSCIAGFDNVVACSLGVFTGCAQFVSGFVQAVTDRVLAHSDLCGDSRERQSLIEVERGKFIGRDVATVTIVSSTVFYGTRRVHNLSSECGFYEAAGIIVHNCLENEDAGPIDLEDVFPSGDYAPLLHPSCQCELALTPLEDQ